ncbi:MAG: T9SS type A sorting domain-containing protein [Bacteroidetes bacterium]|nr:T9SS type A sorting domain-containing protein [Bacteroidota bacterium]
MKIKYIFYIACTFLSLSGFGQNTITWQRTIGGNGSDKLNKMILTSDSGIVLCGYSNSDISGSKKENSLNGSYDYWVVKLSKTGVTQWAKAYGGTDRDLKPTIIQTTDGGYLVGGSSISDQSGVKTENAINESFDYWVLKLDKKGNIEWDNTIGGIQFEKLSTLLETPSGYFLCGSANSTIGYDKTVDNEGTTLWPDYWVVKLNKSGAILWDSVYGNTNRDELSAAVVATDGGIVLGGTSYSPRGGNKKQNYVGNGDFWIIKIDSLGRRVWDRTLGGNLSDYLTSIDVVGNIGYVLGGYSNSPASGNKTDGCRGGTDYWIIRTDKSGIPLWDKTFGGSKEDYLTSVKYISGKYLLGGYSNSGPSGDKTSNKKGGFDFWTLQLDKDGNIEQQNDWGGGGDDYLTDFLPNGTEYILAGTSNSGKTGDKSNNTVGNTKLDDYWVFKVSSSGSSIVQSKDNDTINIDNSKVETIRSMVNMSVSPNPVKDVLYINYNVSTKEKSVISIYNNNGKLIKQDDLSQTSGTYTISFTDQSSGIYYAVLQSGNSSTTRKFVKN